MEWRPGVAAQAVGQNAPARVKAIQQNEPKDASRMMLESW
jgi:hypothetical protein